MIGEVGEDTWRCHVEQLVDCQVNSASSPVSNLNEQMDEVDSYTQVKGNDSEQQASTSKVTNSVVAEPQINSQ